MNRRTFLKLSAAFGVTTLKWPRPLALASILPLPVPHRLYSNSAALLAADLSRFDLLLVPAHIAAELIRRSALRALNGPPGRPHDPDGAFTVPYGWAVAALVYRGARPRTLADLWTREALWPDEPRLGLGAALLRRGHSVNDTHPGHLAQIESDLLKLRPRVVPDPLVGLRAGAASVALAPILVSAGDVAPNVVPPSEGSMLIEYDWVIPAASRDPEAAQELVSALNPPSRMPPPGRHLPLAPLPAPALAQHAAIWARVTRHA